MRSSIIVPKSLSLIIKYFCVAFSVSSRRRLFGPFASGTYYIANFSFWPTRSLAETNIFLLFVFIRKTVNLKLSRMGLLLIFKLNTGTSWTP